MRVRPAAPADAEQIVTINVHTWQVAYAGLMPAPILDAMEVAPRLDRMRDWLSRTDRVGSTLVAVDDADPDDAETVLGYTHYGPYRVDRQPRAWHPTEGEIHAIYVRPEAWGTGAGRAMMDAALAILAAEGRTVVRLWVLADNDRARRFYASAGFVPDGAAELERVTFGEGGVADLPEVRYTRHG